MMQAAGPSGPMSRRANSMTNAPEGDFLPHTQNRTRPSPAIMQHVKKQGRE